MTATEQTKHVERPHAALSGSTAEIWPNCHGFYHLRKDLEPQRVSAAMDEGTYLHDQGEKLLRNFLEYKRTGKDNGERPDAGIKADQLKLIEKYRDLVYSEVLEGTITGKNWGFEDEFAIDKALDMYGYADFWAVYKDDKGRRTGVVVDLKTGYYEVPVDKNAQLAFYAVGLRRFVRNAGKDLDVIRTVIIQPKSDEAYKEAKSVLSSKQLDTWEQKFLKAGVAIMRDGSAKYKTGKWCEKCRCSGICPAQREVLVNKIGLTVLDNPQAKMPSVEKMTDEQILKIYENTEMIQNVIGSVYEYMTARAMAGNPVGDTKVVEGRSNRKWNEDEKFVAEGLKNLGVEPYRQEPRLITLGEAESALGKGKIDSLVIKPVGKPTLVDGSDKRPPLKKAIDMF